MIVIMQTGASEPQIEAVIGQLSQFGFDVHRSSGVNKTVLGAIGVRPDFDLRQVEVLDGVSEVVRVTEPYKLASRTWQGENTVFDVAGAGIGGEDVAVIAAFNPIQDEKALVNAMDMAAKQGAGLVMIHSPSEPASVGGTILAEAAKDAGLGLVYPISDPGRIDDNLDAADMFLVSSADAHQEMLLRMLGQAGKPVMLRRGLASTIEEWLISAEKVLAEGNPHVALCESGIRTFEPYTRYTLDLSAIPVIHRKSHLPVFADPSHGTGIRNKVTPMALAAVAAGADGLVIDVQAHEDASAQEEPQALYANQFVELMRQVRLIAGAIGRSTRS